MPMLHRPLGRRMAKKQSLPGNNWHSPYHQRQYSKISKVYAVGTWQVCSLKTGIDTIQCLLYRPQKVKFRISYNSKNILFWLGSLIPQRTEYIETFKSHFPYMPGALPRRQELNRLVNISQIHSSVMPYGTTLGTDQINTLSVAQFNSAAYIDVIVRAWDNSRAVRITYN